MKENDLDETPSFAVRFLREMSTKVDAGEWRVHLNLSGILRPFRLWLQIIGVHLPVAQISLSWRLVAWLYSCCWIAANIVSHEHFFRHLTINNDTWKTKVYSWNDFILFSNFTVLNIGTHLGLSLVLQWKWKAVWDTFEKMEAQLKSASSVFKSCRLATLGSLAYVAAKETVYLAYFGLYNVELMVFYPSTALALFWALGFTVAKAFQNLAKEIDSSSQEIKKRIAQRKLDNYQIQMHRWSKQHAAIYECADQFNRAFGFILLIEIAYIFVGVINQSFYLVVIFIELKDVDFIATFLLIDHLIQLGFTCYIADDIRFQAFGVARSLLRLQLENSSLENHVRNLLLQVFRFRPKISAMSFFRVHCELFPTLIGTFLTYFIILYQFQSSEMHG